MGIVITDMLGKMVYVKQPAIIQQTSIDVSSFAKGNYIVQISVANRHYYSSLIIAD
jgi:hypothetical protein